MTLKKYLQSHGPLTVADFVRKSGLAASVVRDVLNGKPCSLRTAKLIVRATGRSAVDFADLPPRINLEL